MEDSEKPDEEPRLALARLQAARKKREWRNWQTHYFEVVAPQGVGVQVPPPAQKPEPGLRGFGWITRTILGLMRQLLSRFLFKCNYGILWSLFDKSSA